MRLTRTGIVKLKQRLSTALSVIRKGQDSPLLRLHPELAERVFITSLLGGSGADIPPETDAIDAYEVYGTYIWIHRAVSILADNFAALPVRVVNAEGEALPDHPVSQTLARVNAQMAPGDLWRMWMTEMLLQGEIGLEIDRSQDDPAIHPHQGEYIWVVPDADRKQYFEAAGYKVKDPSNPRKVARFPAEEFLFFKTYNPDDRWRGLSALGAVAMSTKLDLAAQGWSVRNFKRGGRWDFALITPQGITSSEAERYEKTFAAQFMGDSSRVPVLEDGITDIKPFSWAPKDMEWATQREFSRTEIAAIYGVPPELLGFGKATYANFAEAHLVLWTLALVPWTQFRDSVMTEFCQECSGDLKPGERVATDLSNVSALKPDATADIDNAVRLAQTFGLPFNVVNERFGLGFPEMAGGDTGYLPIALQPALREGEQPNKAVKTFVPVLRVKSQGNGTVVRKATPPATGKGRTLYLPAPEYGSPEHEAILKQLDLRVSNFADELIRMLKKDFQRQEIEIKRRLRTQSDRDVPVAIRMGRGNFRDDLDAMVKAAGEAALFDLQDEIARFKEVYGDLFLLAFQEIGQEELGALVRDLTFNMESTDVQIALKQNLTNFAEKLNTTTWTDLVALFQEAEAQGESIAQISERLTEYFDGRKSRYQTDRIARTTLAGAQNSATMEAYRQSGVVEGSQWISALKTNTRIEHRAAHGQFRPIGQSFQVGGEFLRFPGDPLGSAGNIINCLCALVAVVRGVGPDGEIQPESELTQDESTTISVTGGMPDEVEERF
jgi:HK97 family phage portal protein